MFRTITRWVLAAAVLGMAALPGTGSGATVPDCRTCHEKLTASPVVHAAVLAGCRACHTGIDTTVMPHRKTNERPRGLAWELPKLCYGCHDRKNYQGRHNHPAVDQGCGACHDPHSAAIARLLREPIPSLCFKCHDRTNYERKFRHGPGAAGMCLQCHIPHAAKYDAMLRNRADRLCLRCHPRKKADGHLVCTIEGRRHPVGARTDAGKWIADPNRKGKPFSCVSCHDPHGADQRMMIRFPAAGPAGICPYCHKDR